jgi:hypothetical protein
LVSTFDMQGANSIVVPITAIFEEDPSTQRP